MLQKEEVKRDDSHLHSELSCPSQRSTVFCKSVRHWKAAVVRPERCVLTHRFNGDCPLNCRSAPRSLCAPRGSPSRTPFTFHSGDQTVGCRGRGLGRVSRCLGDWSASGTILVSGPRDSSRLARLIRLPSAPHSRRWRPTGSGSPSFPISITLSEGAMPRCTRSSAASRKASLPGLARRMYRWIR